MAENPTTQPDSRSRHTAGGEHPLRARDLLARLGKLSATPVRAAAASARETKRLRRASLVLPWKDTWLHIHRGGSMLWSDERANATAADLYLEAIDVFLWGSELHDGETVVDVGAGVGEDVRVFSDAVGPSGRVIAVEAHPRAFRLLEANVSRWRLPNVTCIHAAVCDAEKIVHITDEGASVGNRLSEDGVIVRGVTLDDLLANVPTIALLKMNIEGSERAAVLGACRVLRRTRRAVISCHDFLVPLGGPAEMATEEAVRTCLTATGMEIAKRPSDSARPWIPFYLYASWPEQGRSNGAT